MQEGERIFKYRYQKPAALKYSSVF